MQIKYEYGLSPKEQTYLRLQLEIAGVVDETSRMFYWASQVNNDKSDRFSVETADALYDIMSRGRDHTEIMVRCYYQSRKQCIHNFELNKIKIWASEVNNHINLYRGFYRTQVKNAMETIERCFEEITSNEWVR